jgi:hypothetical protein
MTSAGVGIANVAVQFSFILCPKRAINLQQDHTYHNNTVANVGVVHEEVGPCVPVALRRSSRKDRLSLSSTHTTFWVMFSEVEPTRPTARKM